ncbi:MAG TPA: UDP-N-acetylmuramoyl-L-alanine--D-glutamate ligase [Gammaproteobacteria bacterium]|jgi:UDP-N-acetylmuramoylalanine--D-glutamate ligase|nr:UDP-N-acetylmuramoyl-L-alanine--D-glutamate ligase [Gammaproteobacteria bacterium]
MGLAATQRRTRTLIVGLGKTGLSCARFLAAHGEEIAITDSRERPPGLADLRELLPDAAVFLGGFSEEALKRADRVVLSPGIASDTPFVAKARALGMPVLGDIELFAHYAHAPVIGITGANGKSTVTTLVGLMAERAGKRARVGGNLGTPALDLLKKDEPDLYVLELSSFQLEITESLPCIAATVLNLSPDHMDRYAGMKDYAAAKARIFRHCRTAVLNREDPWVRAMAPDLKRRVTFGLDVPAAGDYGVSGEGADLWLAKGGERLIPASVLRIQGRHNLANALAALALGEAAGLPMEVMLQELSEFRGLAHRMEFVATTGEVSYYDDSKGTNVGATRAAVQGLSQPLVLIAGGDGKGQDFAPLADALVGKARAVVLLGKDAELIERAVAGRVPVKRVKDMDTAVQVAASLAQAGDMVLLSPACSSLDMFENFEHRGRVFAAAVRRLGGE